MRTIDTNDDLKDRIIADFRSAMAELRCVGSERLVRLGVSMAQLHVMSMLDRHGDMPMSRLADMVDVSLSNATGIIDRMEERGYVERVRVPDDRRVVLVRLTDTGRRLVDDIELLRTETLRIVLDRLDHHQLAGIARATTDLRDALAAVAASARIADHHHGSGRSRPDVASERPARATDPRLPTLALDGDAASAPTRPSQGRD